MDRRDFSSLIKNIYDDTTLDTLRALDSNLITLMSRIIDYKNVQMKGYERVPVKPGSPQSHIRVDVAKDAIRGHFFLTEDFLTRLEEKSEIRHELEEVLKKIKMALQQTKAN
jgi:hypothetical protein